MAKKEFDAIKFKRKISEQFSKKYTNRKGLVDWEKLDRDIKEDKKRRKDNQ